MSYFPFLADVMVIHQMRTMPTFREKETKIYALEMDYMAIEIKKNLMRKSKKNVVSY